MMHEDIKARHEAEMRARMHEEMERQRALGPVPDPKEWAWQLPAAIVATMTSPDCITRGSCCASEAVAQVLRRYGLCEYGGRHLSVFGCAVLKELLGEDC